MARLVAEEGILEGLTFNLDEGTRWTIGRDPASQLVVDDPTLSGTHAVLEKTPNGLLLSKADDNLLVFINGEEIDSPALLKNGDTISLGTHTFRFEQEEPAQSDRYQTEPFELKTAEEPMEPDTKTENQPHEEDTKHDSIYDEDKNVDENKGRLAEINFDLVETGRFLLKVIGGPNNGAEFSLHPGKTYIVGTDPNTCDIIFHDTSVSRQHARLNVSDDETMTLEDLKSRNGTLIEGKSIEGREPLNMNAVVSIGTTSFVVYDREGEMQTIISPLLPQIVKVLQKKEEPKAEETAAKPVEPIAAPPPPKKEKPLGAFILIAIITGLFVLTALGISALLKSEPVEMIPTAQADKELATALDPFKSVRYSFNKSTGRLLLVGHVLTQTDKNQLMYNLQGKKFIKNIDDSGIIIDELVWQNTNEILNRNPAWRGISIQSPSAGNFVLTGYLQTRKQAEQLYDYITSNFPYLNRLDREIVIEEDVVANISNMFQNRDIRSVNVQFANGEVVLSGGVPAAKQDVYNEIVEEIKKIQGVRQVRSQVANLVADQSTINISDRYEVSGFSKSGRNISVVVNGRIVTQGDTLDGMLIKSISPNTILLEKDGVSYRIDFSK